jgi:molybdenum cofactor guanylyltransferase
MIDISGYILAGGASTRMGRPKPSLLLAGKRLTEIAYQKLDKLCTDVALIEKISSNQSDFRTILDAAPDDTQADGPLVAIYTALSDSETEWNFVLACDLPFVTSEFLEYLASSIDDKVDAIVPIQADARAQPLCGLYRRSCLEVAEMELRHGKRSPMALLDRVVTRFIDFSEFEHMESAEEFFLNLNTPQEYDAAKKIVDKRSNIKLTK